MPKPELEFFAPDSIPWQPVPGVAGTEQKILSEDKTTGNHTRLLRFLPGADTRAQGVLRHDHWEEVWIIDGSFEDLTLRKTFSAGMYACRPPGMPHGPWRSANGVMTFEIRYYDKASK